MSNEVNNKEKNSIRLDPVVNPFDRTAQKEGGLYVRKKRKISFWERVPVGTYLVKENLITGKVTSSNEAGIKFMAPFIYQIYFESSKSENVDYEKVNFQTRDGLDVTVDFSLLVVISDPTKYKISSAKPMENLKLLITDLVRRYIIVTDYDDLKRVSFDLNEIDPYGELNTYEDENGVRVIGGNFKTIDLSKHLKDIYDNEKEAKMRQKVAEVDNETKKATSLKEEEAVLERLKMTKQALMDMGYSAENSEKLINEAYFTLTSKKSYNFTGTATQNSSQIVGAEIIAAAVADAVKNANSGLKSNQQNSNPNRLPPLAKRR